MDSRQKAVGRRQEAEPAHAGIAAHVVGDRTVAHGVSRGYRRRTPSQPRQGRQSGQSAVSSRRAWPERSRGLILTCGRLIGGVLAAPARWRWPFLRFTPYAQEQGRRGRGECPGRSRKRYQEPFSASRRLLPRPNTGRNPTGGPLSATASDGAVNSDDQASSCPKSGSASMSSGVVVLAALGRTLEEEAIDNRKEVA